MSHLLDTDACVDWLREHPIMLQRLGEQSWETLAISCVTLTELYYGAYKSNRPTENLILIGHFTQHCRVLPISTEIALRFGQLKAELERAGTRLADFDLLIAATALTEQRVLITKNTRHFDRITGLAIENWTQP